MMENIETSKAPTNETRYRNKRIGCLAGCGTAVESGGLNGLLSVGLIEGVGLGAIAVTGVIVKCLGRTRELWRLNWKSHLRTFFFVAVVLVSVQAWQTRGVPSGLAPNVNLVVVQPNGLSTQSTLQQWRALHPGQPVALHFWADWCPICRTEENSISRLAADWPVLTVAMQSGPLDNVSKVLQQRELPWNTGVDESGNATHAFGFKAVPAFVVVDANGQLRAPTVGYTTEIGMRLRLWWASLIALWKP